jgi:hypothetical protein
LNSKDPSDRANNRSRGAAHDGTDRPGRPTTCLCALVINDAGWWSMQMKDYLSLVFSLVALVFSIVAYRKSNKADVVEAASRKNEILTTPPLLT